MRFSLDSKLVRQAGTFINDQDGGVLVWMAGATFAMIGIMAITVDMSYFYSLENKAQIAADSAALAGVVELPDAQAARNAALEYAELNMPASVHGGVLDNSDIILGNWDEDAKIFTVGGTLENAFRVTVRRAQTNGNEVRTFFGRILDVGSVDIAVSAAAYLPKHDCFSQGIMARGFLQLDQTTVVRDDVCLYGRSGVHFDRDAVMEEGAYVGAYDESTITYDQGFAGDPDTQFGEADPDFSLVSNVDGMVDAIASGDLPDNISNVEVVNEFPDPPTSGTAYVVEPAVPLAEGESFVVNVDKNVSVSDVLIAVRGSIEWGQNGSITNTGSCTSGEPSIGIVTTEDITLHQSSTVDGAQLISGGNLTLHQNSNFRGSAIAGGNVQIDQSPDLNPCEQLYDVPAAGLNVEPRLVL